MKGNGFLLNELIVFEFLILRSRSNHSSSDARKKDIDSQFDNSNLECTYFLSWDFAYTLELDYLGVIMLGFSLFWICNIDLNYLLDFSDSKPNSIKLFSLDVLCTASVMASAAFYWTNSSFSQKHSLEGLP